MYMYILCKQLDGSVILDILDGSVILDIQCTQNVKGRE